MNEIELEMENGKEEAIRDHCWKGLLLDEMRDRDLSGHSHFFRIGYHDKIEDFQDNLDWNCF